MGLRSGDNHYRKSGCIAQERMVKVDMLSAYSHTKGHQKNVRYIRYPFSGENRVANLRGNQCCEKHLFILPQF